MKKCIFVGVLADIMGMKAFDVDVQTPREAFIFLGDQIEGFRKTFIESNYRIALSAKGDALDKVSADFIYPDNYPIYFLPGIQGGKAAPNVGAMTPDASDYENRESENVSTLFNGPVNTVEQGLCVPVIYGFVEDAGSHVVSAGISSERVAI